MKFNLINCYLYYHLLLFSFSFVIANSNKSDQKVRDYFTSYAFENTDKNEESITVVNRFLFSTPEPLTSSFINEYNNTKEPLSRVDILTLLLVCFCTIILITVFFIFKIREQKERIDKECNTLTSVLNSITDGIITTNTKGRIVKSSMQNYSILDLHNSEISGMMIQEVLLKIKCENSEDLLHFFHELYPFNKEISLSNSHFIIEKKFPKKKFISCKVSILNEHNKQSIILSFLDITEDQKQHNNITKINKRLEQTENAAEIGWFDADFSRKKFSMAPSIFNALNIDFCEEMSFEWLLRFLPQEKYNSLRTLMLSNKQNFNTDILFEVNNQKYWFHVAAKSSTFSGNTIRTRQGYIQNITKRKNSEIRINQSQQQFLSIFNNCPTGIVVCTNNGDKIEQNNLASQYLNCIRLNTHGNKNIFNIDFVPSSFVEKVRSKTDVSFTQEFPVVNSKLYNQEKMHLEIIVKHYNKNGDPNDPGILILLIDRTLEYKNQRIIEEQHNLIKEATLSLKIDFWTANILENPESDIADFNLNYILKPEKEKLNIRELLNFTEITERELSYRKLSKMRSGIAGGHSQELRALVNNNIQTILFSSKVVKYEPENNQILLSGIQFNTTEFRHTQNSLELAQEAANIGSWQYNITTHRLSISKVVQKILEYSDADLCEFTEISLFTFLENPRKVIRDFFLMTKNSPQQIKFDIEIITQRKTKKSLLIIGKEIFINHNQTKIIQGIVQDVTDVRKAESKLLQIQQEQNAILNNISNGVVFLSPTLEIIWSNKTAKKILDNNELTTNRKCYNVFYRINKVCKDCPVIKSIKSKKIEHTVLKQPNGRIYRISSVPIYNEDGTLKGIVESFDDFTLLRKREDELKAERVKAEESDRLKSSFLANLSHEIRSPLSNIIGFTRLIARKNYSTEQKDKFIRLIESNQNTLLELINDVLDLSKIEADVITYNKELIDVDQLCLDIIESMSLDLKANVKLHYVPFSKSLMLFSDKTKLTQVISNLISNSKKFTDQGGIWIYVDFIENKKVIEFRISDTGTGIDASFINKIFDRFNKGSSKKSGTGLGLSICKAIVTKLGGKIYVDSEKNSGTTFVFTIPYSGSTAEELNEYRIEKAWKEEKNLLISNDKRPVILVAEDNNNNYLYMETLLHQDYITIRANDGVEAVQICRTEKVDLVLMDIMMPNMDGFEATKKIKNEKPHIPIIAVTAFNDDEIKEKGKEIGFDSIISKPFEDNEIFSKIKMHLYRTEVVEN